MINRRRDSSEYPASTTTFPITTPSRHLDSTRFAQGFSPSERTPTHSRSSSLWTAPSPRQAEHRSSPALPGLPRTTWNDSNSSFQSPQHPRTDSSAYYTAVWGSPYDLPPISQQRRGVQEHHTSSGSEALDESPSLPSRVRQALHPIQQSPVGSDRPQSSVSHINSSLRPLLERSLTTGAPSLTETRYRYGFTQDWLRDNLAGSKNSEKGNWWSDESGGSDTENPKLDGIGRRKPLMKPWLDDTAIYGQEIAQDNLGPLDQSIPRSKVDHQTSMPARTLSAHRSSPSEITVKQEDFDTATRPEQQRMSSVTNTLSSIFASLTNRPDQKSFLKQSEMEKPLPQPPLNRTASEAPTLQHSASYYSPSLEKRPSISSNMSFQRPRKKVVWRGKACIIAMPSEDDSHPRGLARARSRSDSIAMRLREQDWENSDHNVRGFDFAERDAQGNFIGNGQSREIFPDPMEGAHELEKRRFRVSVPNKKAWDDYVDQLKKEKLRALGVSFDDEDPPLPPPLPKGAQPMSRHISNQNTAVPVPFPRPPSLNPGSRPGYPAMSRSPGLEPPPGLSQQPVRPGFQHLPRQSISFHSDLSRVSLPPAMHHQLPSGPWAQAAGFGPLSNRGPSPLDTGLRPNLRTASSYTSSLRRGSVPDDSGRGIAIAQPKHNTDDVRFQPQWQQPRGSISAHRPSINGGNYRPNDDYNVHRFVSQPEIASPVPQGHRHNLSQTLQREIEDAERELEGSDYHLEESVRREFGGDDDLKSVNAGPGSPSTLTPTIPIDGGRSFGRVTSGSDLDTNPSLQNSPATSGFPGRPSFSKHSSKMSTSTLNVNAQEFVLEPQKHAQPSVFSFAGSAKPAISSFGAAPNHPQPQSKDTIPQSNLNVTAPAFTPSIAPKFSAPTREFSFSSSGPTFRPDAPAFQPVGHSSSLTGDQSGSDTGAPRIFGNINFAQLGTKPTKTSKAIPIVKPASTRNSPERDDEGQEDETGRITQAEGRQKRMKKGGDDGDQVPLFATPMEEMEVEPPKRGEELIQKPRHEPVEQLKDQDSEFEGDEPSEEQVSDGNLERADKPLVAEEYLDEPTLKLDIDTLNTISHILDKEEKEASPMERATDQLQELVDDLLTSEAASLANETLLSEELERPWEPIEITNEETSLADKNLESELGDVPSPILSPDKEAKGVDFDGLEVSESPAVQSLSHAPPRSSLSASAAPFEYNPNPNGNAPAPKPGTGPKILIGPIGGLADLALKHDLDPLANMVFSPQSSSEDEANVISPKRSLPPSPIESPVAAEVIAEQLMVETPVTEEQDNMEAIHQEIDDAVQELSRHDPRLDELVENTLDLESDPARSPEQSESSSSSEQSLPRSLLEEASESLASPGPSPFRRDSLPSASPNRLSEAFQHLPGPERRYSADSAVVDFVAHNPRLSPSYRPGRLSSIPSPVHRLNAHDIPVSDWDDLVDSEDEVKFLSRTGFFDKKVDGLVGATVKAHLGPLEQSLAAMRESIAQISARSVSKGVRGRRPVEVKDSDADDEDDEEVLNPRTRSPLKERKLEKIKASISDLVSTQQEFARANDVSQIAQTVAELKTLMQSQLQEPRPKSAEIKNIVEEAVGKQLRGKSAPITSSIQSAGVEKLQLQVAGLESMLEHTEARAEAELQCRVLAEKALEDNTRVLRLTEDEASAQRESAEEAQRSLHAYYEERKQTKQRDLDSDETIEALRNTILGLTEKNTALEETLGEYRISSSQWREEIDEVKAENSNLERTLEATRIDKSNLERTIQALKSELEEGIRGRQALNVKFGRIQEEIARTTQDVARDQSEWRYREEEHKARHDLLSARLEAEAITRERLEVEIERLESQEKEAMKNRFMIERYKEEHEHLSIQIQQFTAEKKHDRDAFAELKRDMHSVHETAKIELEHVRASLEAALESSNHQAKLVREDLEANVVRLQSQLAAAEDDTATLKARHELMLDEASESRNEALREAAEARESAMQEHFRFHERTVESVTQQLMSKLSRALEEKDVDLERARKDHARALEEKELDLERLQNDYASKEAHFAERSALADDKVSHYADRVSHLEEKLAIAKSAAHAAVQAAQSARESTTSSPPAKVAGSPAPSTTQDKSLASPTPSALPSLAPPFSTTTATNLLAPLPPKISPQALRETILVLTEQLRDREARLEALNPDSPQLIRNLELETAWLRELLAVRVDDLKELIASLSQPGGGFDTGRVKDAAIRLKAGLEMELQERERRGPLAVAPGGGQTQLTQQQQQPAAIQFPSLSSITNLATSSPRALPLAAAAAWGNWRKQGGGLGESFAASWGGGGGGGSAAQTPSKPPPSAVVGARNAPQHPSSGSSRFSGLLTPPGTGARTSSTTTTTTTTTPAAMMDGVRERFHVAGGSGAMDGQRRPLGRYAASGSVEGGSGSVMGRSRNEKKGEGGLEEPPRTPTMNLMRRASYDADAESQGHYSLGRYVREREDEDEAEAEAERQGRGGMVGGGEVVADGVRSGEGGVFMG